MKNEKNSIHGPSHDLELQSAMSTFVPWFMDKQKTVCGACLAETMTVFLFYYLHHYTGEGVETLTEEALERYNAVSPALKEHVSFSVEQRKQAETTH